MTYLEWEYVDLYIDNKCAHLRLKVYKLEVDLKDTPAPTTHGLCTAKNGLRLRMLNLDVVNLLRTEKMSEK